MKITSKWLKEENACSAGVAWFTKQKKTDSAVVLNSLIKQGELDWATWLIVRLMTRPQYLLYVIFAAEQVIDIFEKSYPDKRPRLAIESVRSCLENDTEENRTAAKSAANSAYSAAQAANSAAYSAANSAAYSAAHAAYSAANAAANSAHAANSAANSAAYSANAAAYSAANAASYSADAAACSANANDKKKILLYGVGLLKKG